MLSQKDQALVNDIRMRIRTRFELADFEPFYFYKATWSEVVMFYESDPGHRDHVSLVLFKYHMSLKEAEYA